MYTVQNVEAVGSGSQSGRAQVGPGQVGPGRAGSF